MGFSKMTEKENNEEVEYNENNAQIIGRLLAWWFGNADRDNHHDEEIKRANENHKRSTYRNMLGEEVE